MKIASKAILAAAAALLAAFPATAQNDSTELFDAGSGAATAAAPAAASPAAADSSFELGLAGCHEFGYRLPAYNSESFDYGSVMKDPYFSNELDLGVQDGDLKIVSDWRVELDPLAGGSWESLTASKPLESYVSWAPEGWKLSAGYQDFSWGVADRKNPTDNLNPRDYTVGVDPDKIPVLSADLTWYPMDKLSVEGVFLPVAQSSAYPVDLVGAAEAGFEALASMYSAKYAASYAALGALGYAGIGHQALGAEDPALEPENSIGGGKLSYHSAALDASFSYLYDIDPLYTPVVAETENTYDLGALGSYTVPTGLSVSFERERIQRFGLDAKTTVGKLGLWTEACYSLTKSSGASDDYAYRRSKLDYVLGADFSFGAHDSGYANLQYFGTWIPGYDDSFYEDLAAGRVADPAVAVERALTESMGLDTEGLLQGATFDLKYELADGAFTPQLTGVVAVPFEYDEMNAAGQEVRRYCSVALNPEIDIRPADSFHILIGADLAYAWCRVGDQAVTTDVSTDKIGVYTPENDVYLKFLYKWNYGLKK
jgi:hypothetical protein